MTKALNALTSLLQDHAAGKTRGVTSVCSAHPLVIEAALMEAAATGQIACIEATCNQVNQDGGYTGMTPEDFRAFVLGIAAGLHFPADHILFGGDHLGPNPWRKGPAAAAMAKAIAMTHAYAAAGFGKIHLDASMSCADDPVPLAAATMAQRAAQLAQAAEAGAKAAGHPAPAYIIGTEVPVPGGAAEHLDSLTLTTPTDASQTMAIHAAAFAALGLQSAFARVVGLVVQPGVEFGQDNVIAYAPAAADKLIRARPGLNAVYEAHSTDYQSAAALRALVQGGFAILKVGPGLTFALREALYSLDLIAGQIAPGYAAQSLPRAMEALMQAHPADWAAYCHGASTDQHMQRHFGYSDRIRYYWNRPEAQAAVQTLMAALQGRAIPDPVISQYLPRVLGGPTDARGLLLAAIRTSLAPYSFACRG